MKASELIHQLQILINEHGDLEVNRFSPSGRGDVRKPTISFCKILSKRESKPEFWREWESEEKKGEKVIYL